MQGPRGMEGNYPGKSAEVHLCKEDCAKLAKDGLVHASKVRLLVEGRKEPWMDNLLEVGVVATTRDGSGERGRSRGETRQVSGSKTGVKQFPKLKKEEGQEEKEKEAATGGGQGEAKGGRGQGLGSNVWPHSYGPVSSHQEEGAEKSGESSPQERAESGFEQQHIGKQFIRNQPCSGGGGHLFGEELKVKALWKRYPVALTVSTLEKMQPWNLDFSSLPPLYSQYWRMVLAPKMSGPMGRETQTLCFIQDLVLQGHKAAAADVVTQRLKSLEQVAAGGHYQITQCQELVPLEVAYMTSPVEAIEA